MRVERSRICKEVGARRGVGDSAAIEYDRLLRDAARFRARSTSHTVAVRDGCTNIPLAAGRAQEDENLSRKRRFRPRPASVRPPGSVRTDHVLRITVLDDVEDGPTVRQA